MDICTNRGMDFEVPPRTRFYSLQPYGVGTTLVESLSSYLNRLGVEHCNTPRDLLREINCCGHQVNLYWYWSINGLSDITKQYVDAISTMTGVKDLIRLTMLPYQDVLSETPEKIMRHNKAWCPACLEEWKCNGLPIYEPLLWYLAPVEVCHLHHCKLVMQCPYCGSANPILNTKSKMGFCNTCRSWLGDNSSCVSEKNEESYQEWVAQQFADLLAMTDPINFPTRAGVRQSLNRLLEELYIGDINAFARAVGTASNNVTGWLQKDQQLTISFILKICYSSEISLFNFLSGEFLEAKAKILLLEPHKKTKLDKEKIKCELENALSIYEKTSLNKIAKKNGVTIHFLQHNFSQLCRAIVDKNEELLRKKSELLLQSIKGAIVSLSQQGIYPSRNKVAQTVGVDKVVIFSKWKKAKEELGMD